MAKSDRKLNVVIIGAGRIGAFFDKPGSDHVLTHAHAFSMHPGFNLLGFCDRNRAAAARAATVWGGVPKTIGEFFEDRVDLITIAAPDEQHYPLLKQVAQYPVGMIFLEKPVATTLDQAREIRELCRRKKIPVCLNYRRRFVPAFKKIRKDIVRGRFGAYLSGSGYYGKGVLHNGSHLIDLLRYLVSEPNDFSIIEHAFDYTKNDPSVSALLRLKNGRTFTMHHLDHRLYTMFEMDLCFEKIRLRIIDSGFTIEMHKIKKDPLFNGYRNMEKTRDINTSLGNSLSFAADNIYRHIKRGDPLDCSINDGVQAMKICSEIIEAVKKHGT